MPMLSAIAQPQPLCYLPHFFWDRLLPSNSNSIGFKQVRIQISTCLENFEIFCLFGGPKINIHSPLQHKILGPLNSGQLRQQRYQSLTIIYVHYILMVSLKLFLLPVNVVGLSRARAQRKFFFENLIVFLSNFLAQVRKEHNYLH